MTETASPESLRDISNAVAAAIDAEAADEACHWAQKGLDRQGFKAAVIRLPEHAPKLGDWCDEKWAGGTTIPTAFGPNVALWRSDAVPDEDNPEMVISWEEAADLLPQLARLVQDHETKAAADREHRINELATAIHSSETGCNQPNTAPCIFCERSATYVVDNPPA